MTPPGKTYLTESASTLSGGWVANGAVSDGCGKFPAAIPIPDYQLGVTTGNGASNTYRNVPDVAMPSDFVEIDLNLAPIGVGGTSASGPLWAGFMALVNQQCSINQLGPVGFANPALYSIARTRGTTSDTYGTSFHDVMGGANHVYGCTPPNPAPGCQCSDSGTNGNSAGIGYDLVTGLGSPRFELIGQLASTTPVSVLDVSTGEALTCIVRSNHTVMCWGFNGPAIGALGNGSSVDNSDVPVTVTGITTAARVSVGGFHACALLQNGAVQCWGNNDRGQLGNGTTVNSSVPTQVSGLSAATGISAVGAYPWGGEHTCAVLASGEVMCWGANSSGQLGDGTTFDRSAPVLVAGIGGAAGVSAGGTDTCAWLKAGGVRCWGSNQQGQLGNGTTTASLVPVPVSASALGNGVTPVSASGEDYNCALRGDGVVLCWGGNQFGALGIGTTDDSWVPVPVSGITSATNVSAGIFHACAALKDGTIRCWGEDDALGNGSTATGVSTNPVEVTALSTATWVAAGYSYSCAISPTALSCWGLNYEGQLGIGSVYNSFVPATVHFF
jgi:alpha-tubulin suppressor-like RCC1 family protein